MRKSADSGVFGELAADEAVLVLLRVEVIQGLLEREDTVGVFGEHHDKGGIPHEKAVKEGGFDKAADKAGVYRGLTDVAKGGLPRVIVAVDVILVPVEDGFGKTVTNFLIRRGVIFLFLSIDENIFFNIGVVFIGGVSHFLFL